MATIDTSIYSQFAPRVKSVSEYDAEADNNALRRLQFESAREQAAAARAESEGKNAFMQFQRSLAGTPEDQIGQRMIGAGYLSQGADWNKGLSERQAKQAETQLKTAQAGKATAETSGEKLKNQVAAMEYHSRFVPGIKSVEEAVQWSQALLREGVLDPAKYEQGLANLQRLGQTPEGLEEWKRQAQAGGMSMLDRMKQELEAQKAAEIARHNKSAEGIQIRGQDVTAATARRGQDIGAATAREGHQIQREQQAGAVTYQQDGEGNYIALPTKPGAGPVTPKAVVGADGQPVRAKPKGNSSDAIRDAKDVLSLLDMAEAKDSSGASMLDRSTGSYGGMAVDLAARGLGLSTQGDDAAAQLKALEGSLVSKMPKMSGPQSDKDVLLYRQMAGEIGDPSIPAGRKKAAISVIRQINERYAGSGAQSQPSAAPPAAPQAGQVLKGYRFKGGDPSSQASWEKV